MDGAPLSNQLVQAECWQTELTLHRGAPPSCQQSAVWAESARSNHMAEPILLWREALWQGMAHAGDSPLMVAYLAHEQWRT
jgi:hypothetical protein